MSGVAFIDTETTGLDPDRNPIWEIAVIVDDVEHVWTVDGWWNLPIFADHEVPPTNDLYASQWVLDNTRFGDYRTLQPAGLSPFASIERFAELVDGRHLVGAVPSFDEERLRREYRKYIDEHATQFPWHYHLIDVEAMAVGAYSERRRQSAADDISNDGHETLTKLTLPWNSDELSRSVGVDSHKFDRHTALGDARWAKRMYEAMVE